MASFVSLILNLSNEVWVLIISALSFFGPLLKIYQMYNSSDLDDLDRLADFRLLLSRLSLLYSGLAVLILYFGRSHLSETMSVKLFLAFVAMSLYKALIVSFWRYGMRAKWNMDEKNRSIRAIVVGGILFSLFVWPVVWPVLLNVIKFRLILSA